MIFAAFLIALSFLPGCRCLIKPSIPVVGIRSIVRDTKLRDIVTTTESTLSVGSAFSLSINDLQNTLIIVSGLAYYLNENKPRGNSRDDLLEVRKSIKIPNNLGVFAKTFIPTGTVIGEYPGFVKTFETFQKSSKFNHIIILKFTAAIILIYFCFHQKLMKKHTRSRRNIPGKFRKINYWIQQIKMGI